MVARSGVVLLLLMMMMLVIAACSGGDDQGAAPVTGPATVPPTSVEVSSEAESVVSAADLGLSGEQAVCVGARLDADDGLRDALAADPEGARRAELLGLVSECAQVATFAREFAEGIQVQAQGALSADQLTCLRDGVASWPPDLYGRLVKGGLFPQDADPAAEEALDALIVDCGVELPPPPIR